MAGDGDDRGGKRQKLGQVLQLNVGGSHVDVSRSTLEQLPYFRALIEQAEELGRPMDADKDGRMFVDRDGELFRLVLQYIRTRRRPAPREVPNVGALMLEAEFYGCEDLKLELEDKTSNSVLRVCDRELRDREHKFALQFADSDVSLENLPSVDELIDVFQNVELFKIQPRKDLGYPLLFEEKCPLPPVGESSIALRTHKQFARRLKEFSAGMSTHLTDDSILISGTIVVNALTRERQCMTVRSDLVVSICNTSPEHARLLFDLTLEAFKQVVVDQDRRTETVRVVRTKGDVVMLALDTDDSPIVTVELAIYRTPAEVIFTRPLDTGCVVYSPSAGKVYCAPRFLRALNHRANVVDTRFRTSVMYDDLLELDSTVGYCVAVPGLQKDLIDAALLQQRHINLTDLDLLLRLGSRVDPPEPVVYPMQFPGRDRSGGMRMRCLDWPRRVVAGDEYRADLAVSAQIVPPSIERMLILDSLTVEKWCSSDVARGCSGNVVGKVPMTGPDRAVSLVSICVKHVTDLSLDPTLERLVESNEEGAMVVSMLEHLGTAFMEEHSRVLGWPHTNVTCYDSADQLQCLLVRRLNQSEPVGLVWCNTEVADRDHTDLEHVEDARRPPLDEGGDYNFEHNHGLPRRLAFFPLTAQLHRQHGRPLYHVIRGLKTTHLRPLFFNVYSFNRM